MLPLHTHDSTDYPMHQWCPAHSRRVAVPGGWQCLESPTYAMRYQRRCSRPKAFANVVRPPRPERQNPPSLRHPRHPMHLRTPRSAPMQLVLHRRPQHTACQQPHQRTAPARREIDLHSIGPLNSARRPIDTWTVMTSRAMRGGEFKLSKADLQTPRGS